MPMDFLENTNNVKSGVALTSHASINGWGSCISEEAQDEIVTLIEYLSPTNKAIANKRQLRDRPYQRHNSALGAMIYRAAEMLLNDAERTKRAIAKLAWLSNKK